MSGQSVITDPDAGVWANVLNLRYRMMLSYLAHTYRAPRAGAGQDGECRGVIINKLFGEMYNLRSISALLVRLPLAPGSQSIEGTHFKCRIHFNCQRAKRSSGRFIST